MPFVRPGRGRLPADVGAPGLWLRFRRLSPDADAGGLSFSGAPEGGGQSGRHHRRPLDGPFPAGMGRAGIRPLERPDQLDRIGRSGHPVFFRDGELCGGIRARRDAAPGGARLAPRPRNAAGSRGGDSQRPAPGHTLERAFSGGCFRLVEARPERPRGQGHQPLEQPPHGGPPGSGPKTVCAHQHGPQGAGPRSRPDCSGR